MDQLLELKSLSKVYKSNSLASGEQKTVALDRLNLQIFSGEILAIIGESGSGKSTLAKLIAGLEKPSDGDMFFQSTQNVNGPKLNVQMVFQDPYACLNPVFPVSQPVVRALQLKQGLSKQQAQVRAVEIFESVGLTPAPAMLRRYPHELSGGQRQRVAIARAVATGPDLLIADEPTSMLDVSIRIDILNLLRDLRDKENIGIVLITHDVASAWYLADRIAVLYSGQMVEMGTADQIALDPKHPYTKILIAASQNRKLGLQGKAANTKPNLINVATGTGEGSLCKFLPRCSEAVGACSKMEPVLERQPDGRLLRCLLCEYAKTSGVMMH